MKKHLLFNQLFGTEGSPNQTGETLTRENRIGLMSYLRRTLMLLFAVLVMSVANVGMAWGETITITPALVTNCTVTYEYTTGSGTSIKDKELWVEVPSSTASGQIFIMGSDNKDRFAYIYKTNGTVKDTERKIVMKKDVYPDPILFTSGDIKTSGGKYYLVFSTSDDFKYLKVKFALVSTTKISTSNFYQLYASSEKTAAQLITAASLPSYIDMNANAVLSNSGCSSSVTTPHDFSSISSGTTYYRLKPNSSTITLYALANVKSIRLYGNGKGGGRTVSVGVTKISGSGSAMTVSSLSMSNAEKVVAEYTTGDLTSLTGYDANTYYNYTFTIPSNDSHLWGIYVEAGAASCTAPNHVDLSSSTDEFGFFGGETINLTAQAYSSEGTGSPIAEANITGYQWKHNGVNIVGATSKTYIKENCTVEDAGDYSCVVSTGATCSTESALYGTKVYVLQNYTGGTTTYNFTRTGSSKAGTVAVTLANNTQYQFKIYAGSTASTDYYMGNNGTIEQDISNWDFEGGKNNVKLNSGLGGTFTFAIDYSANGGAPKISVTYPRKTIYMKCGSTWCNDSPAFFAHTYGVSNYDVKLTQNVCDATVYQANIPAYNSKVVFTRQAPGSESIAWSGNANYWNESQEITLSTYDLFTCTGWADGKGTFSRETYSPTTYTISFAKNGADGGDDMEDVGSIACDASVTLEANTWTKTGYTFTGWKDGSSNDYADETTISNIRADIELTAQWTAKQCTVTFDKESGSGGSNNATATYDAAMPDITPPTRAGYDFAGYWDGDNGTGTQYYKADGTSNRSWDKNTTSNTTLYAKWTAHVYTVTLDLEGGSGTTSVTATYNATLSGDALFAAPTFSGYTFGGFYTEEAGGGSELINSTCKWNKSKTGYIDGDKKWTYSGADNITLKAKWTQTVTLDDNGGSADGSVSMTYKGSAGTPSEPTYAGHTVDLGYYAESSCTNLVMGTGGALEASVTDGSSVVWTNSSSKWVHAGSSTLYAHWKCNTPTITDNGDNTVTITVPAGTTVRYTTDGTPPTSSTGTVYSSPFSIVADCTVKAIAYQSGCTDSEVVSEDCTYSGGGGDCVYSEVAKVTLTGKSSAPTCTGSYSPSGAVSGLQDGSVSDYYKLGGKPSYVKLQLGGGNTFQAGDSIILEIRAGDLDPASGTGSQTSTPVRLFTDEGETAFYTSSALTANTLHIVRIKVTADMISAGLSNKVYIYRTTDDASPRYSQNHQVKSIAVKHCIPSCTTPAAPTSPTNGATTSNSQAVSWTDASNDAWEVYVNTSSSTPDAGQSPTAEPTTATYTFTGLTASTEYHWWVRSVCDASHKSAWVAGSSFTTSAAPTLYTVTFDSNGGSSVSPIAQASEGASISMPDAPTYSGYTFQGWVIGGTTYAAGASYTPTSNITAYASWKETCAGGGGGGSGATLFSQNFNSATTIYVKNTTNVAKSLDGTNGINILGSTAASQFTSFYGNQKSSAGFGLNNTNANDTAFNAAFGVYANNTGYKYCLAKTTNFSATPPTAIKVVMHMKLKGLNGQNGAAVLGFAVGSGFKDKTSMDGQKTDSIHSAFSFNNHTTNHTITSYNTTTSISGDNVIADNTEVTITWVINNSGIALNYSDPASGETELGNDKFDVWVGSTKYVAGQSANNGAKALRQLIIGDPSGKKHVFTLNDITVTDLSPAGGGCYYVTYNGNGAEAGSISDATAHTSGSNVTVLGNTGGSAFTKTGYRFNGWNTSATGNGTAYVAGATISAISADVTLYAQWVADACSAPSEPTISGTSVRTVGQTIELTAFCESGKDASTTYTWYKGGTFAGAEQVQAPLTIEEGGRIFNKASCVAGDAGTYWCEASNGDGCESHNATGFTVTVNDAAGDEHIYYYKDADHYDSETGTYYNPEGNTATLKDNQALSSPWTICDGCMTGVDSVVAHGATYDGKGNWVNAYIKLPTGGDATTKNIKFALTAGYTGTLTMKIGGYENNPTVTLQPLTAGVLGSAITPTSGTVGGVATTEDNFNAIEWPLATAGGTYVLTVTSKTGYISQIDMTTSTSATFNVTYNGNGNTGGTVPTDATNYASGATVTVAANTGDGKLVKENYTGAGWNTANNGTGTNYVPGTGTFSITANTTLYAHWTQLITLAPGAQGTGTNNAAVSWNGSVLRGFAAHTASGYALQGYYTEPSGGTKVLNADGSFAATDIDGFVTSGKWSNTGAAPTLYAQWEASNLLKWNLKVNVSETSITTLSKESAAPTVIAVANMINLTNNGSLTITGSAKSALTSKIATTASATGDDAGKYMSVQFIVAAGYQLVPSDIKVKVQPISHSQTTKLILENNNSQSISYTSGSLSKGSTHTVTMTNSEEVAFTGTVTLKIYVYGTAESDGYRLGTPIEINGSVEATCTPPTFSGISYSATEYTVGASASAISVTGATNVDTYLWKQNDVNDRSGGTAASGTNDAVSYTPPTSAADTMYYWCEMTNACTTVKTAAVGIMVRNATTDPTVTWSDVKLNDATATPNYGGGNYVLRATVDQSAWTGTLAASMITAPAGIRIHHVTTDTDGSGKKYIEFKFDVTTAFDRASNATIDFNLALPEAGSYSALNSVKSVTYNDCSGGAAGQVAIKMGATASTSKSNPQNYWETAGAGRLMFNYGSNMGSSYNSAGYKTADSTFYYYAASTGQKWMFQTYIAGVNKVRVVFRAAGTIKSSKATITNFYYNTEYFASPGSNAVSFGDVNANKAGYSSGEDGYIEFTVPEMAANSYGAFVTADGNMKVYGVVLYSDNAGGGGSVPTNPAWSDSKADGFTVTKTQSDANFGYTISTTTNTLGAISYSSSNPSVAAVDPVTGEVTITATGASAQSATITATLARSGCYQGATRTYTIEVEGYSCPEPSGSIELTSGSATKCASESVTLTMTGFTEGASIQWYNGESTISNGGDYEIETTATRSTLTTTSAGTYSAIATVAEGCVSGAKRTNSITIANMDMSEQKTVRKVSQWYVKNGRLTPDIALWQLGEGETFKSVAWSPSNATGLDFVTRSGIVYLEGKEPSTNTSGADIPYTLTLTITDACGTDHELSGQTIKLTHQKNTDKHVLAFVVNGTAKGGFTEGLTAAQTTGVSLYNTIAAQFDVQATNIYSTDDEQKLREYYSQYDILCITDYPNTQTKGANSKSYVDAIGALIDIRPILTMEAFVSALPNWKLKGVSGNPKSPSTRQYTMLLQCKDHEIFSGTTLTKVGEGEDAMYRVKMVDKNQEEYKTLDANYGDGEHKANEGYQYGKKPALQGFTYTEEMSDNNMLPLGLIDDGAGNDLQVGIERQAVMEARMMVLGINSYAMERLDKDGQTIVINALKYLMKKSAEDISDCSVYFDGSDETDPTNWDNELNWGPSYASLPLPHQEVRILKECIVKDGVVARASGIKIIPRGRINHDTDEASGSLTIEPGGALIVDGKVRAAVAPNYFTAIQTTPSNLVLQSNSSAQAALILDNSEGETQATVQMYSPSYWEYLEGTNKKKSYWSYVAVPIQDVNIGEFFYGAVTYLYDETSGWIRKGMYTQLHAFEGIGLSLPEGHTETFYGSLAPTGEKDVTLTVSACGGENLIGNSWTAPIQIANFEASDFGSATQSVMIYCTGRDGTQDDVRENAEYVTATAENDGNVNAGQWLTIPIGVPSLDGYDGLKVIPAMQAFQVNATSETTLHLDYDKLVRDVDVSDNLTEKQHAPARRSSGAKKSLMSTMRVRVSGVKTRTDVWLLEDDRFSNEFDNGWEAKYVECDDRSAQLYAQSEIGNMSFLAKPDIEGTVLGFAPSKDGNQYLFTFHYVGDDEYYLNDLKLTTATLISAENSYLFTYEEGDTNRFYISRQPLGAPAVATGVDNPREEAKPRKFIYNDKMYILFNGRVFDATGKIVK